MHTTGFADFPPIDKPSLFMPAAVRGGAAVIEWLEEIDASLTV